MITAVVLAAGASTRMGTHKLLLPLGNESLVRRTVRQILAAGFDDRVVTVGPEHERVVATFQHLTVRYAINAQYERGMGSSFRVAVESMPGSTAAMFALADQPLVASSDYHLLLDAYRTGAAGIISVRYGEITAPPHLFDRRYFPELARLEHGARPVLQRHQNDTHMLHFAPDLLLDIDTPADYERAKAFVSDER